MRTRIRNVAGIVSKYAKIGLVLFYVLQVTVLFREQIVHLYKTALETVHAGKDAHAAPVVAAHHVGDKHRDNRPIVQEPRFVAASSLPTAFLVIAEEHRGHDPHPHHDDDKHKDKARRDRRAHGGEWFIMNLYSRIKNAPTPDGSDEAHAPTTLRLLSFTA